MKLAFRLLGLTGLIGVCALWVLLSDGQGVGAIANAVVMGSFIGAIERLSR